MKKFHLVRISWYLYSIDMFFSVLNKWHNITFTSFESKTVYVCSVLICSFVFVEYTRCPAQALYENCEIRGPWSGVQGLGWGLYCHIVKVHEIFSSPIYIREKLNAWLGCRWSLLPKVWNSWSSCSGDWALGRGQYGHSEIVLIKYFLLYYNSCGR